MVDGFIVATSSNSTVTDMTFLEDKLELWFNVTGPDGTKGFCIVVIPKDLLWGEIPHPYIILLNDTLIDYTWTHNATHAFVTLFYDHSTQPVRILGVDTTPPTADADGPYQVYEYQPVVFDGTGSSDNVGIVSYVWTFTDVTGPQTLTGPQPSYTFTTPGNYTVTLTVSDAKGNIGSQVTDQANVTVLIDDIDPIARIKEPADGTTIDEDTPVTFDASTSGDLWIGIANYTWNFGDGNITTLTTPIITHVYTEPGNYTVTLTATDKRGNKDTTSIVIAIAPPGPNAFHFLAWIDGSDWVYIQGNEVWYVHRNFQFPGIWAPGDQTVNNPTYINNNPWYPEWPDDWGYDDYGQRSLNKYTNLYPPLFEIVTLTMIQARHSISVVQFPSIQNDYTAIILLDDDPPGGAAWYEFELSYTSLISATIDIDPDTLNLKSKGQWITAFMQLPEGYNPEDIDVTTILLNETIQPVLDPKYDFVTNSSEYIVDHDGDGVLERMVKFNRTEGASWIYGDLGIQYGNVTLTVTGELFEGTPFEGSDTIKVLFPGDVDDDGDVDRYYLGLFAGAYGTSLADAAYNWAADFNEDGSIDRYDFSILAAYYGKTAV